MNKKLTLGSLFSGSGGFELAGTLCGIKPVFNCEIEPFPIMVTSKRFPDVKHYGDISTLNGAELPPVDIITFGSPCFPAGTLILSEIGYMPIEMVKVGTRVLTHRGEWKKVTAIGAKLSNTILLRGNHYGLETTPNHPIYSAKLERHYPRYPNGKRGNERFVSNEKSWTAAENMKCLLWAVPNEIAPLPIPAPAYSGDHREKKMPEINSELFYFIGRWLGDGWVRDSQRSGRPLGQCSSNIILCSSAAKETAAQKAVENVTERYSIERAETAVKFTFCGSAFCSWLTDNFGKYAVGKELPAWAYGMPAEYREALLKGVCDTDGYCRGDNRYSIATISKKLAHGLRLLAETLGYSTTIFYSPSRTNGVIQGRAVSQQPLYTVAITKSHTRKRLSDAGHSWYMVKSVESTGRIKTVYNLTVEDDNSYIADGITVHNCTDMSIAGKRAGLGGSQSVLFYEAIRVIKEMRCKTNGSYPRYICWENVCFDEDTYITCENGYKRIKDIHIGDRVKTHIGRFMPVVKVHQTQKQKVLKLKVSGSEDVLVTPNHPFLAVKKIYSGNEVVGITKPEWTPAEKLTDRHLIGYRIDTPNLPENFITESEAWAVGRWMADGSVDLTKSNPRLFFSIGIGKEADAREHLNRLPYSVYENKPHPTATNFCFTSHEFYALVSEAGIGAGNKKVPPYVFQLPLSLKKAVLDGYISGDGYIRQRGNNIEVFASTASRELAYGIARLIRNVYRVAANISVRTAKEGNINGREIHVNYPCYTINASLTNKMSPSVLADEIIWQPVKSIEDIDTKKTVYNLSVLEDNTYAANDIIVHNCGAFSSNKGADFKSVLEAIIGIAQPNAEVPAPVVVTSSEPLVSGQARKSRSLRCSSSPHNVEGHCGDPIKWPYADLYLGDGWSVAYRTVDAQYYGISQRRRRIYLVADFAGEGAGNILFERQGVSRDFAPSGSPWKGAAADAENGAGAAGGNERIASTLTAAYGTKWNGNNGAYSGGNFAFDSPLVLNDQGGDRMDISEGVTATLRAEAHHPPIVTQSSGFCTEHSAKSRSIGYEEERSPTLRAGVVPGVAIENHPTDGRCKLETAGKVQTLTSRMGTGGMNTPLVLDTPTAYGICSDKSNSMLSENPHSGIYKADTSRTIDTSGIPPGCQQGGIAVVEPVAFTQNQRDEVRDLNGKSGAIQAQPGMKQQTYVLQGSMIGRDDKNGPQGSGINEDISFTLDTSDHHAVAYAMTTGSFVQATEEQSPTLLSRDYKDAPVVTQPAYGIDRAAFNQGMNAQYKPGIEEEQQPTLTSRGPGAVAQPMPEYIVRRLTPTECARLQGFPSWWTDNLGIENPTEDEIAFWTEVWETHRRIVGTSSKPKSRKQILKWLKNPYSDSAAYKMWGNGIALPCAVFVLTGIMENEDTV